MPACTLCSSKELCGLGEGREEVDHFGGEAPPTQKQG